MIEALSIFGTLIVVFGTMTVLMVMSNSDDHEEAAA